jgi:hypothetical protein
MEQPMLQNYPSILFRQREAGKTYSSGRTNSKPNRRISPAESWRKTLAMIGGVSLGTRLEEAGDGAGMVR